MVREMENFPKHGKSNIFFIKGRKCNLIPLKPVHIDSNKISWDRKMKYLGTSAWNLRSTLKNILHNALNIHAARFCFICFNIVNIILSWEWTSIRRTKKCIRIKEFPLNLSTRHWQTFFVLTRKISNIRRPSANVSDFTIIGADCSYFISKIILNNEMFKVADIYIYIYCVARIVLTSKTLSAYFNTINIFLITKIVEWIN